jgi:hypothetical protein
MIARFHGFRGVENIDFPLRTLSPLESALARVGGTSLFNEALLWAFRGGAAKGPQDVPEWHVTAADLFAKVKAMVSSLASNFDEEQNVDPAGFRRRSSGRIGVH